MFPKLALTAFLATLSALLARADVTPSDPGPGTVSNAGSVCHITWIGDSTSPTAWKDMSIELMTGSNYNMIHLTTVASNLDGTIAGKYDWTCPEVSPNSAIYFYQFTAPNAPDKQWTTRFTIASSSGQTTPPTNATQPGTGEAIPWGTGALVDPSTASANSNTSAVTSSAVSSSSAGTTTTAGTSSGSSTSFTTVVVTTSTPTTSATGASNPNGATIIYTHSISSLVLSTWVMTLMAVIF